MSGRFTTVRFKPLIDQGFTTVRFKSLIDQGFTTVRFKPLIDQGFTTARFKPLIDTLIPLFIYIVELFTFTFRDLKTAMY